jgi:hypothetical protein
MFFKLNNNVLHYELFHNAHIFFHQNDSSTEGNYDTYVYFLYFTGKLSLMLSGVIMSLSMAVASLHKPAFANSWIYM